MERARHGRQCNRRARAAWFALHRHYDGVEVDDLYGLPLDRFVAERGVLARALRADGRRDEAAGVASLRKPSVAAWAINQLVRTQGRAVARLYDAGEALRGAQADVLAGHGGGRALRDAAERERAAVETLVSAARGLLTSDGHELSAAIIDRVAETLHAAALDDDAQRNVRGGRLERELRHVGFGLGEGAAIAPDRRVSMRKSPARRTAAEPRHTPARAARERAAQQRAAAERERADARKAARAAAAEARRLSGRAARAVRVAEQRRERAAKALRDADQALAAARDQAEVATDAYRRAQDDLKSI